MGRIARSGWGFADVSVDSDRGTPVTLSSSTASRPTFTAPSSGGTLNFRLVVNDGEVNSSPSTVAITVSGGSNQAAGGGCGNTQTGRLGRRWSWTT